MRTTMALRQWRLTPTITGTLVALVGLATMLAAAGGGVLAHVGGSADRLVEQANAPHVAQLHTGTVDDAALAAWARSDPRIRAHQHTVLLGLDGDQLTFAGRSQSASAQQNSLVVPTVGRDRLLRADGSALQQVQPGQVWLPVHYRIEQGLQAGQTLTITAPGGFRRDLTIAGFVRDAIMSTAIAGSKRLAVSEQDFALIRAHTGTEEHLIGLWLTDPGEAVAVSTSYAASGMPADGPTVTTTAFRLFIVIGEGLSAAVVLLASVLMMAVGVVCLRLVLLTALHQEQHQVAVLRAIGVAPRAVRRMYLARYAVIAAAGGVLGLAAALALIPVLTTNLVAYTGHTATWMAVAAPAAMAMLVLAVVLAAVQRMLRRIGQGSPAQGLREATAPTGQARRRRGPSVFHVRSLTWVPAPVLWGVHAVLREPQRYLLLLVVFASSVVIAVVPVRAAATFASPQFPHTVGVPAGDLLIHLPSNATEEQGALLAQVAADPAVRDTVATTTTRWTAHDQHGVPVNVDVTSGDHTRYPRTYSEGRAPRSATEVALSARLLAELDAQVGDRLTLRGHGRQAGGRQASVRIVGTYQDVTHGGLTAEGQLDAGSTPLRSMIAVHLKPGEDPAAVAARFSAQHSEATVTPARSHAEQLFGPIAHQVRLVARVACAAALLLCALMAALTTRLLLAAEHNHIAVLRHMGVGLRAVRTAYLTRVLVVLLLAIPVGTVAADQLAQTTLSAAFEVLYSGGLPTGASQLPLVTDPGLTWGVIPAVFVTATALAAAAACWRPAPARPTPGGPS